MTDSRNDTQLLISRALASPAGLRIPAASNPEARTIAQRLYQHRAPLTIRIIFDGEALQHFVLLLKKSPRAD